MSSVTPCSAAATIRKRPRLIVNAPLNKTVAAAAVAPPPTPVAVVVVEEPKEKKIKTTEEVRMTQINIVETADDVDDYVSHTYVIPSEKIPAEILTSLATLCTTKNIRQDQRVKGAKLLEMVDKVKDFLAEYDYNRHDATRQFTWLEPGKKVIEAIYNYTTIMVAVDEGSGLHDYPLDDIASPITDDIDSEEDDDDEEDEEDDDEEETN
jgi:hypothetical protein